VNTLLDAYQFDPTFTRRRVDAVALVFPILHLNTWFATSLPENVFTAANVPAVVGEKAR
jgi:hypothetical protein